VDGGVDFKTAADCAQAGADGFHQAKPPLFEKRNLRGGGDEMRALIMKQAGQVPA